MSIFIRGVFSFACHLHFNQEILLRAESCLCPDPKAWGLANVFACNLIFIFSEASNTRIYFVSRKLLKIPPTNYCVPLQFFCESW